ncbi:hypothetical protein [Tumebacillus permanentifrigoris]|uniref:Copper resistance protein D n=1 Tax=Tumebacillus permanentifrigoris TaxID=378543 RepID=A0A316DAX3_9BACL|nr:hypothetical protein [Tumebacillus permanentifrigoris]PWK14878.1 hypothetical protein C7459_10480 [Tumebacillus permanentifrigoris]
METELLLFLHLLGLSFWIGSMVLLVILLLAVRRNLTSWNGTPLFLWITRLVTRFLNVAALVVLVSGGGLIQMLGYTQASKPLWIKLMEQGGGLTLLLFIVVMTWFGNRARKQLRAPQDPARSDVPKWMTRYSTALSLFATLAVLVLMVVSFRVS